MPSLEEGLSFPLSLSIYIYISAVSGASFLAERTLLYQPSAKYFDWCWPHHEHERVLPDVKVPTPAARFDGGPAWQPVDGAVDADSHPAELAVFSSRH